MYLFIVLISHPYPLEVDLDIKPNMILLVFFDDSNIVFVKQLLWAAPQYKPLFYFSPLYSQSY